MMFHRPENSLNQLSTRTHFVIELHMWKHTETSMHPSSQKGKWNDAPMAALTSLISECDTY
jgi:hypothetical protein